MNTFRMTFASFGCTLMFRPLIADDGKPSHREKLETAIPEGIRLLETKEYVSFLKQFVPPDDLKRITNAIASPVFRHRGRF